MYKRLICILLTLSLCVGCFAFSASAVESEHSGGWVSLFDYDPNRPRTFVMNSDLPSRTTFSIPSTVRVFHVDALLFYIGPGSPTLYVNNGVANYNYQMETMALGNNLYRLVGNVSLSNWSSVNTILWLTGAEPDTNYYMTWLDFKVCTVSRDFFNDGVRFFGLGGAPFSSGGLVFAPSDLYHFYPLDDGSPFQVEIVVPASQRFDYYDMAFSFSNISIDSVSAGYDGQFFDISSSFITSGDTSNVWYGSVSLNCDNYWMWGNGDITVRISGVCYPYSFFQLLKAQGSIDVSAPDPELSWLQKIWVQIQLVGSNTANSITSALTDFFEDFTFDFNLGIDFGISEIIDSISGVVDSVGNFISDVVTTIRESVNAVTSGISDAISGVITSVGDFISGGIDSVVSSIDGLFGNLGDWLSGGFEYVVDELISFLGGLFNIEYRPPEIDSSIVDRVDGIENDYRGEVVGGMESNDIVSDQADIILLKYSGALLAVTGIMAKLIDHSFFTNILYFALSLGITALIFNVVVSLDKPTNGNKKSGKFEKPRKKSKKS